MHEWIVIWCEFEYKGRKLNNSWKTAPLRRKRLSADQGRNLIGYCRAALQHKLAYQVADRAIVPQQLSEWVTSIAILQGLIFITFQFLVVLPCLRSLWFDDNPTTSISSSVTDSFCKFWLILTLFSGFIISIYMKCQELLYCQCSRGLRCTYFYMKSECDVWTVNDSESE